MNVGFSVGTLVAPLLFLIGALVVAWNFKNGWVALGGMIISLAVFFNLQTYGPRNELVSHIPPPPTKNVVESGSELIPKPDKWEHFDSVVEKHEDRQK